MKGFYVYIRNANRRWRGAWVPVAAETILDYWSVTNLVLARIGEVEEAELEIYWIEELT